MSDTRTHDRDWSRTDAWLGMASLVVFLVANRIDGVVTSIAFRFIIRLTLLAQPYFLLRVARHFLDVPAWALRVAAAGAIVVTVITVAINASGGPRLVALIATIVVLSELAGAALFWFISRKHRGMVRFRFTVAAAGAVCLAVFFVIAPFRSGPRIGPDPLAFWNNLSFLGVLICGYFGLVPPRFVRRWAQAGEETRFMQITSDRPPVERGARVAQDLADAVARGVTASCVAVVIGDDLLEVRGANRPGWVGQSAVPTGGAGRAIRERGVVVAPIDQLEWEWRGAARSATRFLAMPILGASRPWGAVIVTQRHASLFPKDDVDLLERLCRYAAGILDHSALLEAERLRQQRDADQRLGVILDSLTDYAVVTVDVTGKIVEASTGSQTVFGKPPGSLIGTFVGALFDGGAPWLPAALAKARQGEAFMQDVPVHRGGASFTGSMVLRAVLERGVPSARSVLVIRDVTHQRVLEQRLRHAEKMEAMGQMTAGIAHNFSNMVHVIQAHNEELRQRWLDMDAMAQVRAIGNALDRAKDLARQLLSFGKSQPGMVVTAPMAELVHEILPMIDTVLTSSVALETDVDPAAPTITVDRSRFEQVIVNIAVNARDAIQGNGSLRVAVRGMRLEGAQAASLGLPSGTYGLLEMRDTGVGMDAATRARIFEPFFTTKARGTGLGLATVQASVIEMGGVVDVQSTPGIGTTFLIYIPAHVPAA